MLEKNSAIQFNNNANNKTGITERNKNRSHSISQSPNTLINDSKTKKKLTGYTHHYYVS